jgi:hypothetical protein
MTLWRLGVLSLFMSLLISCGTTANVTVPSELLSCERRVSIPGKKGERLPGAEIGALILRLEYRGDDCADRLNRVGKLLRQQGAVTGD